MRILIFSLAVFTIVNTKAQNCKEYLVTEKDKFSEKISTKTDPIIIQNGDKNLAIAFLYGSKSMHLVLISNENLSLDCVENGSIVKFLFQDGAKMQEMHLSEFNCKGMFDLVFPNYGLVKRGNRERFLNFVNNRVTDIRLYLKDDIRDFSLSKDAGDALKELAGCMYDIAYGDKKNVKEEYP